MISYCCNQQVATIQNKQKGTKHMNPSDLTPEQQQSLGGMKTKTVYERTNYSTDITTGEILRTDTETIKKTTSEPEFIKLYYRTMLAFNGVDDVSGSSCGVVGSVSICRCHLPFTKSKFARSFLMESH